MPTQIIKKNTSTTRHEYDEARTQRRRTSGRQTVEDAEQEKLRRQVLSLIRDGQVGRAMNRVTSHGVAPAGDRGVQEQIAAKYPARFRPLPESVIRGQAVGDLKGLREALQKLQRGVSPGCGGCRADYLALLGEQLEEADMGRLEAFGMAYIESRLPEWFYTVALTLQTVALYKNEEQVAARPLGLRHPLLKVLSREVVAQNRTPLRKYLEPQQLVMAPAGAAKLIFSVRAALEAHPDWVCVPLDLDNAYNAMARAACVENLEAELSLQHLAQFFATTLAPTFPLEAKGKVWGESGEGMAQGMPDSTAGFAVGLQPLLVKLDQEVRAGGGFAVAGADDIFPVGPPGVVLEAVGNFQREAALRCGMTLNMSKSRLFTWEGDLPPESPPSLTLAGEMVEGRFLRGFLCYGCPVGEDEYVRFKLKGVADRIVKDAAKTVEVLARDKQGLWAALRASVSQRFDYWCQLVRPSLSRPVAAYLDTQLWRVLEAAVGFRIPRAGHLLGEGADFTLDLPVQGLEGRTFSELVLRQPVKLHGAGFRSLEESCYPAYIGALEQAAPFMASMTALQHVVGGEEAWGVDADPANRWAHLLTSGHMDGVELQTAVLSLQLEARETAVYLEEEVEGVLTDRVEGIGKDTTGTTRRCITEQREMARGRLLLRGLEDYEDREARPVWSWPERDKHSSAWLLCLPGPDFDLTAAEFSESFAALLCQPSPACSSMVGRPVPGGERVCRWGDKVVSAPMKGDGFRKRHDATKLRIQHLLRGADIPVQSEVFNEFADLIPQAGLSRIERGRRRQGLVPDFKLRGRKGRYCAS